MNGSKHYESTMHTVFQNLFSSVLEAVSLPAALNRTSRVSDMERAFSCWCQNWRCAADNEPGRYESNSFQKFLSSVPDFNSNLYQCA